MSEMQSIRKKANRYFFRKVLFNILLTVIGAVLIAVFLRRMQNRISLMKQEQNSAKALSEAVETLEMNRKDAAELTKIYHDGNQEIAENIKNLLDSGLFSFLTGADAGTRADVFRDIVSRSGVDYLYILGHDGRILLAPDREFIGVDTVQAGLLTEANRDLLLLGTENRDGTVVPALESNEYGTYYFYSVTDSWQVEGSAAPFTYSVVLGADAKTLDVQIASLKDIGIVLSRATVSNDGFLFAVNNEDRSFLYYQNGQDVLTGTDALEAGLSAAALEDGYTGFETIRGVRYLCVSKNFGTSTVVCAVAEEIKIVSKDRYVLFWSITGFVLVMILCLAYAVIVRNDFVRKSVETEKQVLFKRNQNAWHFDKSIFKKIFPLMIVGVVLIFGITFYSQTLLEMSEGIDNAKIALDDVGKRYLENQENRKLIETYYNNQFASKAKMLSYLIGEDPAPLNEATSRYHSYYDEQGHKQYLTDDEGNRLRSVSKSALLQQLCEENEIDAIYLFDESGHTIATNTSNWFFTISHNEADQSYPFLAVVDGMEDELIQEPMVNDLGQQSQYIGVAFDYYTRLDENGDTVYVSRYDYEAQRQGLADPEALVTEITEHRSMLQIGLDTELTARLKASTDLDYILSSNMLQGGYIILFDNTPAHVCVYSPLTASIGIPAADLGISEKAFTGTDYYGFLSVNGIEYYMYFRYTDGYFLASAFPKSEMFQTRTAVSLMTALVSLVLILFLSGTVTMTTVEEETLYAAMGDSDAQNKLDSAIFNIILPSGRSASTTKAAARWDSHTLTWSERGPEQKLALMFSVLGGILILYVIVTVLGARTFFSEGSVIRYILSGNWDRGLNIFAFSACALVLIFVSIAVAILRIPVRIVTSLLGTRSETIGHLLLSVVRYGGALAAIFYCLYLLGLDARSLLASAGILSLVIGLGAQSLIQDIIAGIFIVFEGEFRVGDIVTISGFRGTVMDIGLRTTKILEPMGNIKIYNNSNISGVLNMTKEASVAICTIGIEYGQDIDYVEAVLNRELPALQEKNPQILDGPEYAGVSELGDSGVNILVFCKCQEVNIKGVTRYLNREILKIFYRNGINVPFPNVTVSHLDMTGRKTMEDFTPAEEEHTDE